MVASVRVPVPVFVTVTPHAAVHCPVVSSQVVSASDASSDTCDFGSKKPKSIRSRRSPTPKGIGVENSSAFLPYAP